jgi:ABC-type branched-subunit amino acid transport system substrate-binding protein
MGARSRHIELGVVCAFAAALSCVADDRAKEPVRIGAFMDLSGEAAAVGLLVEREVNAAGGLLDGRPLEMIIADDRSKPARAAQLASEMKEDGIVGFVGPVLSAMAAAVQPIAAQAPAIPMVSCCATSPTLSSLPSFFRTAPSDEQQAQAAAQVSATCGCMRLAVLYVPDAYGEPLGKLIAEAFVARGGKVVARTPLASDVASYHDELLALRERAPDCIALVLFTPGAGRVLREWHELSSERTQFIGTDSVYAVDLEPNVGDLALLDGLVGTTPASTPDTPSYLRFEASYQLSYGRGVQPGTSAMYDAAALLVLAIEAAGSTRGAAIMDALRDVSRPPGPVLGATELVTALSELRAGIDLNYDGASGAVDLDARGNVTSPYDVFRYDAAEQAFMLEPLEAFTCEP